MKVLGIDTSSLATSVAVIEDNKLICEYTINTKKTHSQKLMPMIENMLNISDLNINEIDLIAVCEGPGSFTGIRIAITIAKTISYCLNIPIYTVSYLELSALDNIGNRTYAVQENNGYYKAEFLDDKMTSQITYVKSKTLLNNEIVAEKINFEKIPTYKYLTLTDCYNANPLYIKTIEALNDKKNNN